MHSPSRPLPQTLRLVLQTYLGILPGLLLFEILYKALAALALRPALSWMTNTLLGLGGRGLVFNENILSIFTNLLGLLAAALLAALATALSYYEFSALFLSAHCRACGRPVSFRLALELGFTAMHGLKSPWSLFFAVYVLGLLPLADLGLSSSLLPTLRIPSFITGELAKTSLGGVLVALFYAAVLAVFLLLLFALPALILGREPFGPAARRSLTAARLLGWRGWALCGGFAALWWVLFRSPGLVPTHFVGITGAGVHEFTANLLNGRILSSLPAFALSGLLRIALTLLLVSLLTVLYAQLDGPAQLDETRLPAISARVDWTQLAARRLWQRARRGASSLWALVRKRPFYQKHKKLVWAALVFVALWIITDIFTVPPGLHAPIAVGHRGSAQGVENTVEAVQGAIDAGADYAEIDVLLSKDNVPMVIHDADLSRLAGTRGGVYDFTAEELQKLTLSQNGFTGRISTLEEMLGFCDGKIRLVVELKTHGRESGDVAALVAETVERAGAGERCIFMSIDYAMAQRLRELRPQWVVGYCVYGNVGGLSTGALLELDVDFLTIEESVVNPRFVGQCLQAGLPVYVWTVDDPGKMETYLKTGVNGIVSDDPALAKEAVSGYGGEPMEEFYRWQKGDTPDF